ncbi:MAG: YceD family protein [Gammaproteobacteria bacterium]|jgi:uncharacterized protein
MSCPLPESLDVYRLARERSGLTGDLAVRSMPRLAEMVLASNEFASVSLNFAMEEGSGLCRITGRVACGVTLRCQRCLEPVEVGVESVIDLVAVRDDREAGRLMSDGEPLLTADGVVVTAELVEDELILALPVVALHTSGAECGKLARRVEESRPTEEPARKNPFAVLAELKRNK